MIIDLLDGGCGSQSSSRPGLHGVCCTCCDGADKSGEEIAYTGQPERGRLTLDGVSGWRGRVGRWCAPVMKENMEVRRRRMAIN